MIQHRAKSSMYPRMGLWRAIRPRRDSGAFKVSTPTVRFVLAAVACVAVPGALHAQALPVATADPISTGFRLPTAGGSLQYSLSGVESLTSGYSAASGWQASSGLTGNLAMVTSSKAYPFSMIVSGGRFWSTSSQPSTNYADVAISQVINTHRWNAVLTDSVAYLPATPSVGLSGVPGTGDVGIPPIQVGINPAQGILTPYSTQISNSALANVQRRITARSSFNVGGTYMMLRFVGNSAGTGINSNAYNGNIGVSYTLDPRTSLTGTYSYATYSYTGRLGGFSSQTASISYSHQLSRRLSVDASVGPQWSTIGVQNPLLYPFATIPPGTSVNLFLSMDANYSTKITNYSLGYSRGTNSGFGVIPGGRSDSVRFTASRTFDRVWSLSTSAAYSRTTSIQGTQQFAPSTLVAAVQGARGLGRSFSVFTSYTLEKQSSTGTSIGVFDLFTGSFQVASFGLTYSPKALRFGPH
jgi:hypothetical protein